ncbi:substrate-binding domain-containing protein [Micromonospora globbae]|uniref:substrate-binding domain-containing protein n=1 Tax=Micromonospora globbae TaxID=1894969 RepID=UPI003434ED77
MTTIRQDFEAVGRRAIEVVTQAIRGAELHPSPLVVPTLVVRESTAPPAATDA